MVRIGSDQLPVYTHPDWKYFYKKTDVINHAQKLYSKVGDLARKNDVRISFHPGQFCVMASDKPAVVMYTFQASKGQKEYERLLKG